jgi:hypothetical protein
MIEDHQLHQKRSASLSTSEVLSSSRKRYSQELMLQELKVEEETWEDFFANEIEWFLSLNNFSEMNKSLVIQAFSLIKYESRMIRGEFFEAFKLLEKEFRDQVCMLFYCTIRHLPNNADLNDLKLAMFYSTDLMTDIVDSNGGYSADRVKLPELFFDKHHPQNFDDEDYTENLSSKIAKFFINRIF